MRNERTPRTLAECQWISGYTQAHLHEITATERIAGRLLAVAIGIAIGLVLMYGRG